MAPEKTKAGGKSRSTPQHKGRGAHDPSKMGGEHGGEFGREGAGEGGETGGEFGREGEGERGGQRSGGKKR